MVSLKKIATIASQNILVPSVLSAPVVLIHLATIMELVLKHWMEMAPVTVTTVGPGPSVTSSV